MSTLYVVSPPREIFEGLKPEVKQHIVMLPDFLRYPAERFKGITRSLLAGRIPLPKRILYYWFPKEHFDRIIHARPGDAILIYEACNVRVLRAIRPYLPKGVPCYIYYCNPVGTTFRRPAEELKAIRALGYRLTSFDPCEAERYGMACTGQYFRYPDRQPGSITSDCFFCGLPKDRAALLRDLRTRLEAEALTCDFVIPRTPAEKLTYPQYLDRLARTRCVVDIPAGANGADPPPPRSPLLRQEAPDEQPADSFLRLLPPAERLHPRQRPRGQPPCLHRKPHSRSPRTRPRRLRCERVDKALPAVKEKHEIQSWKTSCNVRQRFPKLENMPQRAATIPKAGKPAATCSNDSQSRKTRRNVQQRFPKLESFLQRAAGNPGRKLMQASNSFPLNR